tara:strand:- start:24567 stop:24842 length:276 start_codon:yes stop_codon:yes gene_type:complete
MNGYGLARALSNENSGFGSLNFPDRELGKVHVVEFETVDDDRKSIRALNWIGTRGVEGVNYEVLITPSSKCTSRLRVFLSRVAVRINEKKS